MRLYIVRHAWAEDPDDPRWPVDRDRPLTKEGRRRFAEVVRLLAKRGFAPGLIATSPAVRCVETARLIADEAPCGAKIVERAELAAPSDLKGLIAWTERSAAPESEVAWVGHAPDVSDLAAELLGIRGGEIRFPKGAVLALEFEGPPAPAGGELQWLATAKLLGC